MDKEKKSSYEAVYQRQYRRDNPGRTKQWELNTARNKLEKAGYKVSAKAKKKRPEEMTDDELREALEDKRRRNRESCYKWRKKNPKRYATYQKEYRQTHNQAAALKKEYDRRQNGE